MTMITTTYLIASAIFFSLCAIGAGLKGKTPPDVFAVGVHTVFATFGWMCVALRQLT